jgi:uncharacterized membrane protein HdeD (DUF308 family)
MTENKQETLTASGVVTRLWQSRLVAGLVAVALGAVVLAWPGPSIVVAATLFGVYLLVSGVAELYLAVKLPISAATRVMLFISGAASVVLAILSFRHFGDTYAVLLLSLWIGIGFVIQGISATAVSIGEPELPGRGWYVVAGIVSVLGGLVVLVWPFDSITVLTLAAGIWLVVIGAIQVVQAFEIRSDAKAAHKKVDAIKSRLAAA